MNLFFRIIDDKNFRNFIIRVFLNMILIRRIKLQIIILFDYEQTIIQIKNDLKKFNRIFIIMND